MDQCYEVFVADTPSALEVHHRIRFQVYCLEARLEPSDQHPSGIETDLWDRHSTAFIVRERATGSWVGTMRLVRPRQRTLPLRRVATLHAEHAPRAAEGAWELSRIAVTRDSARDAARRRGSGLLAIMLRAAIEYTRDHGVGHLFFLANPALGRIVERMGFAIDKAGPACDYRGKRHPYVADLDEAVRQAVTRSERMAQLFSRNVLPYRRCSEDTDPCASSWQVGSCEVAA